MKTSGYLRGQAPPFIFFLQGRGYDSGMLRFNSVYLCRAWLQKQASDPFVAMARREGFVARSAYKLSHIDDKYSIFARGSTASKYTVIDLGAAPGGWLQVIQRRVPSETLLFAVDLQTMRVSTAGVHAIQGDFSSPAVQHQLQEQLSVRGVAGEVDVITSDMSPKLGDKFSGTQKQIQLVKNAAVFAVAQLRVGGHFVCKLLGDPDGHRHLIQYVNQNFLSVRRVKPPASRMTSSEIFLVCKSKLAQPRIIDSDANNGRSTQNRLGRTAFGLDDWPGFARR